MVGTDPKFVEILDRSRAQAKAGQVVSLEDLKRKYRITPKQSRRRRTAIAGYPAESEHAGFFTER